jgi:hypothetical protein
VVDPSAHNDSRERAQAAAKAARKKPEPQKSEYRYFVFCKPPKKTN